MVWVRQSNCHITSKQGRSPVIHFSMLDAQAILQYFEDIKAVYKWYDSYFLGRATGGWVSRAMTAWTSKQRRLYAAQTCQQYMDRTFADEKLKGVLCALWGDYGLLPDKVTFMQHALVAGNNFEGATLESLGFEGAHWHRMPAMGLGQVGPLSQYRPSRLFLSRQAPGTQGSGRGPSPRAPSASSSERGARCSSPHARWRF